MSDGRVRLSSTPPGVTLGPLSLIQAGQARSFVIEIGVSRFFGFAVRHEDVVHGYVDRCPHMGLPLAQKLDDYLSPSGDLIACSWHGALFNIDTGLCIGGPCLAQRLQPWPLLVRNGQIVTA